MQQTIQLGGRNVRAYAFNSIVVGSGAAGLGAASYLGRRAPGSVALVTEGMNMGTSRNTGSDKQTYYKLSTCGYDGDSPRAMGRTLFAGGATDGDTALAEAALSARCFFHLVDIGVPFPHNAHGEYVGYKTDHDPFRRGSSAGPLTSKFMTERLEHLVRQLGLPLFDRHQVVEILTADREDGSREVVGALALDLERLEDPDGRYVLFAARNIVYATGGEAGMYKASVYPASQTGGTGVALRAGARGKNLTESQFGIASTAFRWNLSGTYQQVLPRYVSTDSQGNDEREFLDPYFASPQPLLRAMFLKGYQWPFDPRKIADGGSSLIDILVHHETEFLQRRVFLDYTRNPSCADKNGSLDISLLDDESRDYLANSGALLATPIERLAHMNPAAIQLYTSHGIHLHEERLEIAVCAQHNNGGLAGDMWWQSNIHGLFPVGEVNGSHGIYRPGGAALNAGQTGAVRAGEYILHRRSGAPPAPDVIAAAAGACLETAIAYGEDALSPERENMDIQAERRELRQRMTRAGAHIRAEVLVREEVANAARQVARLEHAAGIDRARALPELHKTRDLAVCQYVHLCAIEDYLRRGGGSRGSYLVQDDKEACAAPGLPDTFRFRLDDGALDAKVQEIAYSGGTCQIVWRDVRPLPPEDDWFESVWARYDSGALYE